MSEPTSPGRPSLRRHALVAALLAGTSLGAFAAVPTLAAMAQPAAPSNAPHPAVALQPPGPRVNGQAPVNQAMPAHPELPSFVDLVKQVRPAVVTVTNYLKSGADVQEDDGENNPPMPQLPFPFNQFPFNGFGQQHPHAQAVEARGSGFIINPDGLIITNNHVVKDDARLSVTLADGQKFAATVVGTDPRTDIAVIRIHADHPLPYLQLGDSRDVEPGEWVIAIGDPFGLSETVTAGIISAVGRNIGDGPYDRFIQVDAPINRGNSGGPLITQNGKVVGMNTAILSPTGGSVGIGFAIPSDMIEKISTDLIKYGRVTRGYLGVEAQEVTGAMSKALGLRQPGGALVAQVEPNTPASEAGVQPGDVIEQVNGEPIKNPSQLAMVISGIAPGHVAKLGVMRDGHQQTLDVHLAELPSEQQMAANRPGGGEQHQQTKLGLALGPISPGIASQLELPDGTHGAVVTSVRPGSPAEVAGLQPGDVIVGVGLRKVSGPSEAAQAIQAALRHDHDAVALRIIRNGQPAFVAVNVNQNGQPPGNG